MSNEQCVSYRSRRSLSIDAVVYTIGIDKAENGLSWILWLMLSRPPPSYSLRTNLKSWIALNKIQENCGRLVDVRSSNSQIRTPLHLRGSLGSRRSLRPELTPHCGAARSLPAIRQFRRGRDTTRGFGGEFCNRHLRVHIFLSIFHREVW